MLAPARRRVARIARQLCAADQQHLRSSPSAAAAATPEKVFSDDEMEAWRESGWIVLREAVASLVLALCIIWQKRAGVMWFLSSVRS